MPRFLSGMFRTEIGRNPGLRAGCDTGAPRRFMCGHRRTHHVTRARSGSESKMRKWDTRAGSNVMMHGRNRRTPPCSGEQLTSAKRRRLVMRNPAGRPLRGFHRL